MSRVGELSPSLAKHVLDRMGSTGQPPERGAQCVNVATEDLLEVLRTEYLVPMRETGRNSTFKLVQAPFGGGKTQFLHCLRELAWSEGFATALVGLSPKECPFDKPVLIYQEVARRIELPVDSLEDEPSQGIERVLRGIAEQRVEEAGADAFRGWLRDEFSRQNIESRMFLRGVRLFLEAVVDDDVDQEELMSDYLSGADVSKSELSEHKLRESLGHENAFRWLRSLAQTLNALGLPGLVLMFDEMDRNMSLGGARRRAIDDNLRQMIDYCGQSMLPGVVWCYAVPPEFMETVVPEYPALAQRLKGAGAFSGRSPIQPIIDLDHLPLEPAALFEAIGHRLLELAAHAHGHSFDMGIQSNNLSSLAHELADRSFETGTRRMFVKAAVSMIESQRREGDRELSPGEITRAAGSVTADEPAMMPGEDEF